MTDDDTPLPTAMVTAACARAIAAGTKTQIRRVVRPDEPPDAPSPFGIPGGRLDLRAHGDGAPPVPVVVRAVRRERLRDIRDADLAREGALWRDSTPPAGERDRDGFARWWDSVHPRPGTRWADDPEVWVVEFARA